MDGIGDYLYIIFVVIAIISSLFKPKKKRPATTNTEPERFPDEWERNIFEELEKPKRNEPVVPIKQREIKKAEPSKKPFMQTSKKQTVNLPTEKTEIETNEEVNITLEDMPSDINQWRKAFIHNEIFKRKY